MKYIFHPEALEEYQSAISYFFQTSFFSENFTPTYV